VGRNIRHRCGEHVRALLIHKAGAAAFALCLLVSGAHILLALALAAYPSLACQHLKLVDRRARVRSVTRRSARFGRRAEDGRPHHPGHQQGDDRNPVGQSFAPGRGVGRHGVGLSSRHNGTYFAAAGARRADDNMAGRPPILTKSGGPA
jgi:hypothetical protein